MSKYNRKNIDRKTNKPTPNVTEGLDPDLILNRANQTRRDDDIIRTKKRTLYDIDFAIKWYIDNEIQPQIADTDTLINIPVIFANGEKWDNVRRLGYLRDEKGMLQSPLIMLKRSSAVERDGMKTLDVNRMPQQNFLTTRQRYNPRNRYEDELTPIPSTDPTILGESQKIFVVDIPKYMTIEYEMMVWCDFTTQLNDVVDQILPYGRYLWGNEGNRFATSIGSITFETVNTSGEDRLVRATIPLTVQGTLLSSQEARISTLKTMYSIKKVTFDTVLDLDSNVFDSTTIPIALQNAAQFIFSGTPVQVNMPGMAGTGGSIDATTLSYLIALTEKYGSYVNDTTITVSSYVKINPSNDAAATKNEFDIYINGQYIDKVAYNWTPSALTTQIITFDTAALGYTISADDLIVINGRWA